MFFVFSAIFLTSLAVICYSSYLVISHIIDKGTHPLEVTLWNLFEQGIIA